MKIVFWKKLEKDLKKAPNGRLIFKFNENILALKAGEEVKMKKLKWSKINFRIKILDYRLWLKIENWEILIERFLHRKDIYKKYP